MLFCINLYKLIIKNKKLMKKIFSILTILAVSLISLYTANQAKAVDYTLQQVQAHNTSTNCWVAINNKVYNLTNWINQHPGGASAIINLCGTNGTTAFNNMHTGNTTVAAQLNNYLIGNIIVADTTSPSIPNNLSANAISASKINLTWSASNDNVGVAGYTIFRDNTQIATTTATNFMNIGLNASTTYAYNVKAFDAAGNVSASSTTAIATTLATSTDATAPSAPTNLVAQVISASQINLSWSTSTDNVGVAGYAIFRNNVEIANVTGNSYNNLGLVASTTYNFHVKAFDAAGNLSTSSNLVSATTFGTTTPNDNLAPSVPQKLKAHVVSYKHINLKWKASKDNVRVVGYAIFRNGIQIATVKKNHFNNIDLTPGTTYTYTVRAFDAAGNMSADSNLISATTRIRYENTSRDHDDDDDCDKRESKYENKQAVKIEKLTEKFNEKIEKIKNKK